MGVYTLSTYTCLIGRSGIAYGEHFVRAVIGVYTPTETGVRLFIGRLGPLWDRTQHTPQLVSLIGRSECRASLGVFSLRMHNCVELFHWTCPTCAHL